MTKKDLKQQFEQISHELAQTKQTLRAQIKLNKAKKIRLNEKIANAKNEILDQRESLFKFAFLGGLSLLVSVVSAFLGGAHSLFALLVAVGFGCLGITCGVAGYVGYRKKIKTEKQLLNLEKELSSTLSRSEEVENIEQKLAELYAKRKDIIEKLAVAEQKSGKNKQLIDVLKALEEGDNANRYVTDDFDASNETLLNYQKSLQKKTVEFIK